MSAALNAHSESKTRSGSRLVATLILVVAAVTFTTTDGSAQTAQRGGTTTSARAPYQAYLAAQCLEGSNFCKFIGEDVPADGLLEIQRVACQGWHISTALPSFVTIANLQTSAGEFVRRIDFLKASYWPANGGSVWAISEPVVMFIPGGHRLRIDLNSGTTGVSSYGCTVSGYLTSGA